MLWLGGRLRDRFLVIDVRLRLADTVLAVAGLALITAISHAAGAVAVFVVAGSSCSVSGGSVQPAVGTTLGADQGTIPYAFRHDGTFTACAMTQNRAWFTDATVRGIDAGQLPAAPWRVSLVRDAAPGFRPISAVRLTPRSTHMMFVLVRFTSCRPAMSGRTFTLATLPLRVDAYGRTQTDPVPLSQPVRTSCP